MRSNIKSGMTAYVVAGLCLWAMLPFGGVAQWARATVIVGCLLAGCCGLSMAGVFGPARHVDAGFPGRREDLRRWALPVGLLVGWTLIQLVPLPVRALSWLQPAARDTYGALFDNRGFTSISHDRFLSINGLSYWLAVGLLTWTCSIAFNTVRRRHVLLTTLAAAGTFQALLGMLQHGTKWLDNPFTGERFTGTFTSGNSFGGYLLLTVPLTIGMLLFFVSTYAREQAKILDVKGLVFGVRREYPMRFLWLVVAVVVQGSALILSGSRGAITACIVCVIILTGWFIVGERWRLVSGHAARLLGLCVGLLVVLGLGGGYALTIGRFHDIADPASSISFTARLEIWKAAAKLFLQYPLGVGLDCFGQALIGGHPPFPDRRVFWAHNDYLQALCELGLPGFLLLLAVGAAAVRGVLSRLRAPDGSASVWLQRAAALSLLGGLLHALVDFNLSSRPGVTVSFVVLLGMVLSRSAGEPDEAVANTAVPSRAAASARLGTIAAVLGIGLVGLIGVRFGVSSWLMENAAVSIGEDADDYLWLRRLAPGQGDADRYLRWACVLTPDNARCHYFAGLAHLARFRKDRERAAHDAVAGIPRSAGDELKQIAEAVRLAMRETEAAAYKDAAPFFRKAVSLSPWHPDYRVVLGRACAETSVLDMSEAEQRRMLGDAEKEVRDAVLLAPLDRPVLVRASLALAAMVEATREGNEALALRNSLLEYGGRALRLAGGSPGDILGVFSRVGLLLGQVLALPDLPPPVVWQLYEQHNNPADSDKALQCLAALGRTCRNPSARFVSSLSSANPASWEIFERWQVRERSRWLLRLGRWNDYDAFAVRRAWSFGSVLEEKLKKIESMPGISDQVRRLTLKKIMEEWGLDVPRKLELCGLEYFGGDVTLASRLLAEVAMGKDDVGVALRQWVGSEEDVHALGKDPGFALALTRVCLDEGDCDGTARLLKDVVCRNDISLQFLGRADLVLAKCLVATGQSQAAGEFALRAVKISPTDPDALDVLIKLKGEATIVRDPDGRQATAAEALAAIRPASKIGMRFCGGLVELDGIEIREPSAGQARAGTLLRVFWRFYGTCPSDLKAVAVVQDMDCLTTFCRREQPFRESGGLLYTAGSPPVGSVMVTEFTLPLLPRSENRVQLGLQTESGGRWLPSTENLPYLEMFSGTALGK